MIDLMLKLLTYDPYEKVSGNEKEYIDKVLCGDIASDTFVINKEYVMYNELFRGFISHVQYAVDGINRKRIKRSEKQALRSKVSENTKEARR